jgi:hypothetical protein
MPEPMIWERVKGHAADKTMSQTIHRARVLSGWVVLHIGQNSESMVFIADPEHQWEVDPG